MEMWKTPRKRTAASRQGKGQSGAERTGALPEDKTFIIDLDRRRKAFRRSSSMQRSQASSRIGPSSAITSLADMEDNRRSDSACEVVGQALWRKDHLGGEFQCSGWPGNQQLAESAPLKSRAWHTSPVRHQAGANFDEIFTGRCVAASAVD